MWKLRNELEISELVGKTLIEIAEDKNKVIFITDDGKAYKMFHLPECCESVELEEVIGDWDDLIGKPLLMSEKVTSKENLKPQTYEYDSGTWTFYKFATIKGYVTLRWYGASNGHYSEEVNFIQIGG